MPETVRGGPGLLQQAPRWHHGIDQRPDMGPRAVYLLLLEWIFPDAVWVGQRPRGTGGNYRRRFSARRQRQVWAKLQLRRLRRLPLVQPVRLRSREAGGATASPVRRRLRSWKPRQCASLTGGRGCEILTTWSLRKMRMLMRDDTSQPGRRFAVTQPVPPRPPGCKLLTPDRLTSYARNSSAAAVLAAPFRHPQSAPLTPARPLLVDDEGPGADDVTGVVEHVEGLRRVRPDQAVP